MRDTITDNHKIKLIADLITDDFYTNITELMLVYRIETETEEEEEEIYNKIIKEIITIYK